MDFTFAELLRSFRQRASVKRGELARVLNVHPNTIGSWERGQYPPKTREIVLQVAEELSLSMSEADQLLRTAGYPAEYDTPDPQRYLHQLRAPVRDFVGREQEIDLLVDSFSKAADIGVTAAISGVRGMGGIGKTELAYEVAHRIKHIYPDAQLVVELRGTSSTALIPELALQMIIRSFDREAKLPDDIDQLQNIYRSVLSGKRVLILADNAQEAAQVRPMMPPPGCALLVTSRTHFTLPGMMTLDLATLPVDEAEKLLLEVCPRVSTYAGDLAELCGFLPLALRVSASLLRENPSRDVSYYLEQLRVERLKHLKDPDNPNDPEASVEASLMLSYDALRLAAKRALCQLSVFPASFKQDAAEAIVNVGENVREILELLHRRSLVEWETSTKRYNLHDLIRAFGIARLEDEDNLKLRHAEYYLSTAEHAENNLYLKGDSLTGLATFDQERQQIDAAWQWVRRQTGNTRANRLTVAYPDALAYIGALRYNTRRERIPYLEDALVSARNLGDRSAESAVLGNLGIAYRQIGEYHKAVTCHEQQLRVAIDTGNQDVEITALSNLGNAYYVLGDFNKAVEYHTRHLELARKIGNRQIEAVALGNLGMAYMDLGEAQEAINLYDQCLPVLREYKDRRGEGIALSNMALAYADLEEPQKAVQYYQQSLAILKELGDRYHTKPTHRLHMWVIPRGRNAA